MLQWRGLTSVGHAIVFGVKHMKNLHRVLACSIAAATWFGLSVDASFCRAQEVASSVRATPSTSLKGRVLDADGVPVADAKVTLVADSARLGIAGKGVNAKSPSAVTDAQGSFRFENARRKERFSMYNVLVEAKGWAMSPMPGMFDIEKLLDEGKWVVRLRRATTLHLRFIDTSGRSVAGLRVTPSILADDMSSGVIVGRDKGAFYFSSWMQNTLAKTTDANGWCEFSDLPQGGFLKIDASDSRFARLGETETVYPLWKTAQTVGETVRLLPPSTLKGRVLFSDSHQPVANVPVSAVGLDRDNGSGQSQTNSKGEYSIGGLRPGAYSVMASLSGKLSDDWATRPVDKAEVSIGATAKANDIVLLKGALLTGHVVAAKTQASLSDVSLVVVPAGFTMWSSQAQTARTDKNGNYRVRVPSGGRYRVEFPYNPPEGYFLPDTEPAVKGATNAKFAQGEPGENHVSCEITVAQGGTASLEWTFPRVADVLPIEGRVLDADGKPAVGALVTASASDHWTRIEPMTTDSEGRFSIAGQRNPLHLRARLNDAATTESETALAGNDVVLRLQPHAVVTLSGQVTDDKGAPLANVQVTPLAWSSSSGTYGETVSTDATGHYEITGLWPDYKYSIKATLEGWSEEDSSEATRERTGTVVKAGETHTFGTLKLRRASSFIGGRVVDENGKPVAGASVRVSAYGTPDESVQTSANGRFRFENVVPGKVYLFAQKDDVYKGGEQQAGRDDIVLTLAGVRDLSVKDRIEPKSKDLVGAKAPLLQAAKWLNSPAKTAADLRGKIVVIDFWATWCGPCVASLPDVQKLATRFGKQGVVVIGLHTAGADAKTVVEFARSRGLTYPIAIDTTGGGQTWGKTYWSYGVSAIPLVAVIDRNDKLVYLDHDLDGATDAIIQELARPSKPAPARIATKRP